MPTGVTRTPQRERTGGDPYLDESLADFLDQLAERTPAPGGGAAAAISCAMAAGLVEMATSFASARGLEAVRDRAHALREEVSALAYADGAAYHEVLDALRMPRGDDRAQAIDDTIAEAIRIPVRIAELAAEAAQLAAEMAETGNRNLEGDALAGSLLAEAAARAAAGLAQLNVTMLSKHASAEGGLERLRPALARATRARERAVDAFAIHERKRRS